MPMKYSLCPPGVVLNSVHTLSLRNITGRCEAGGLLYLLYSRINCSTKRLSNVHAAEFLPRRPDLQTTLLPSILSA